MSEIGFREAIVKILRAALALAAWKLGFVTEDKDKILVAELISSAVNGKYL